MNVIQEFSPPGITQHKIYTYRIDSTQYTTENTGYWTKDWHNGPDFCGLKDTESVSVLEGVEEADEEGVVQLHQHFLLPHDILRLPLPHNVSPLQNLNYRQKVNCVTLNNYRHKGTV